MDLQHFHLTLTLLPEVWLVKLVVVQDAKYCNYNWLCNWSTQSINKCCWRACEGGVAIIRKLTLHMWWMFWCLKTCWSCGVKSAYVCSLSLWYMIKECWKARGKDQITLGCCYQGYHIYHDWVVLCDSSTIGLTTVVVGDWEAALAKWHQCTHWCRVLF